MRDPLSLGHFFHEQTVPIRLFLSAYDLSPTLEDVNNTFSVRYFVNLVLVRSLLLFFLVSVISPSFLDFDSLSRRDVPYCGTGG